MRSVFAGRDAATFTPAVMGILPWEASGVAALVDHNAPAGNLHDRASRATLLDRIATLIGQPLLVPIDAEEASKTTTLLVPGDALEQDAAIGAGIFDRSDILGGVVPAFFVGTKGIAHGLVDNKAARPAEWSFDMARLMGDAALPGYTAFNHADAAKAGRLLLARGPVRIKDVCGKAGLGQVVVRDTDELDAELAQEDADELARCRIVLEENLSDVVTYSVGMVELAGDDQLLG